MSYFINLYKKLFLVRYDFDEAIPYYQASDFKGLKEKEETFINSSNAEIHYFTYFYSPLKHHKVVLFLPGMGPGHRAYFKEINEIAKAGYKVITLDYEGCGVSGGDRLPSFYSPTKDTLELIHQLNMKEELVLIGHSLGAFTALNVINKINKIKKAIIISGCLSVEDAMRGFIPSRLIAKKIDRYETSRNNLLLDDNLSYLKSTTNNILFIHSKDDKKMKYNLSIKKVQKLNNKHLDFIIEEGKRHNPNYTLESVKYKDDIIDNYFKKLRKGEFKDLEERKAYLKDASLEKFTAQDESIINKIIQFIG